MTPLEIKVKWKKFEPKLLAGDILLIHKRKGLIPNLIRKRSNSYWNHTALIFKDRSVIKVGSPLIIEAYEDGVEIHTLKKYTENFELYDIGVKRFPNLDRIERKEFSKSFMLNNIDVPYDYSRLLGFLFGDLIERLPPKTYRLFQRTLIHTDAFVCSTFVHKIFLEFQKTRKMKLTGIEAEIQNLERREMTTPGDIAADNHFQWMFNKRL